MTPGSRESTLRSQIERSRDRERAPAGAADRLGRLADRVSGSAIPWPIVQYESGGQNLPPNSAGASR